MFLAEGQVAAADKSRGRNLQQRFQRIREIEPHAFWDA